MGSSIFPTTISPIKSIQRGVTASAGTVTISQINTTKSFVISRSISSSGNIGITGTEIGTLSPSGGSVVGTGGGNAVSGGGSFATYSGTRTVTAGSTSITLAEFGAYITNSTTITTTGACRWEVVEYL